MSWLDSLENKLSKAIALRQARNYQVSYHLHKQISAQAVPGSSLAVQNMYNLADVARRIGKTDEAKQLLEQAVAEAGNEHDKAEAIHHYARYERSQGNLENAERLIDRAHLLISTTKHDAARAYICLDRAAIKALRGKYLEAKIDASRAQILVAKIGESRLHRIRAWVLAHIPWAIRLPGLQWTQGR